MSRSDTNKSASPATSNTTRWSRNTWLALGAGACATIAGVGYFAYRAYRRRSASASSTALSGPRPYDVLLFDIEGTTTPISFVKEILFPYVTNTLNQYLTEHYHEEQTKNDIQALIDLSVADAAAGVAGVAAIPKFPSGNIDASFQKSQLAAVRANVLWQMSSDRKSTPLKQLQGHMWLGGYLSGELKGQLFGGENGDVVQWLRKWHSAGFRLAIYSSGSVAAQQLLFRHSEAGDLTPLLSAYFDTKVGMKQEADSYAKIATQLGVSPSRILFLTDIYGEAAAARQSGVDSVLLVRPGNYDLPTDQQTKHAFPIAHNFDEVHQFIQQRASSVRDPSLTPSAAAASASSSGKKVDTSSGQFNTF